MPRDNSARANARHAKAKREAALSRTELGWPTAPRLAAAGVTSMAVKADDPETRRIIDEAVAARITGTSPLDPPPDSRRTGPKPA